MEQEKTAKAEPSKAAQIVTSMYQEWCSPGIGKLSKALVKLQGELPRAGKTADNPFFKSKYADLTSIMDVVQKPLHDNGFAIISTMDYDDLHPDSVLIYTTLLHESGEWLRGCIKMQPLLAGNRKAPTPQEVGSMITYGKRYGISAMLSLATEDDDGAAASGTIAGAVKIAKEVFPDAEELTIDTLQAALEKAGIGVIKVLKRFNVESMEDLTKEQILEVYTQLKAKGVK
jgi:hypothetical protein